MPKARLAATIALLLVWTASPTLRCLVPSESLTPEEQACCKAMGGNCGGSSASDHPCCKRTTSAVQPAMAVARAVVTAPSAVVASISAIAPPFAEATLASDSLLDPSPPPVSSQVSPILRI